MKRQNIRYSNIDIDNNIDDLDSIEDTIKFSKQNKKKSHHENTFIAKILEVYSNNRAKVYYDNQSTRAHIKGSLKQFSSEGFNLLAVGDFVECIMEDNKPLIVNIQDRKNYFERMLNEKKIIIASNIDQVIITVSFKEPEINLGLIDRYICSSRIKGIVPIICINKIDKCTDREALDKQMKFYIDDDIQVIYTSAETSEGIEDLRLLLIDKESVFSGFSGVGKSSLINKLQPGIKLITATVSDYNKKGRHTTTSSRMIPWDFGGFIIDTPGIKIFGINSENKDKIKYVFPNFDRFVCKFNDCSHTHEKDCGVKIAIEDGKIPNERFDSYQRIIESMEEE